MLMCNDFFCCVMSGANGANLGIFIYLANFFCRIISKTNYLTLTVKVVFIFLSAVSV